MKNILFILLFIINLFTIIKIINADENNKEYMYVNVRSGLNMRSEPSLNSNIITAIPYKEKLEIINKDGPVDIIDNQPGNWFMIKFENQTGWVFNAFLSKLSDNSIIYGKYKLKNDNFSFLNLYNNNEFILKINLCSNIGKITGIFEISGKIITLYIKNKDFNLNNDIENINLEILDENQLVFKGEITACAPKNGDIFIKQ